MSQISSGQPSAQEILTGGSGGGATPPAPLVPTPPISLPPTPPQQGQQSQSTGQEVLFDPNRPPKASVPVSVKLDELLPGHPGFTFTFRLKFSSDMQKKRDAFLNLAPKKQSEAEEGEVLEEVCDLLADDPTGFANWPQTSQAPGDKLRDYIRGITSPVGLQIVKSILRSANLYYWGKVTPREFFPATEDSGA